MSNNRFDRHPKKTLFTVNIILFFVLICGFEQYLAWRKPFEDATQTQIVQRYISLRERPPESIRYFTPDETDATIAETLVRKPYRLEIDEQGFIFPSKIHHQPEITLVFLGGSTTEVLLVDEEIRFPHLVGRMLEQETGKKINAYNAGYPGNNSAHSINILLNKAIPLKPDFVIMMHNINDSMLLIRQDGYWFDEARLLITRENHTPITRIKTGVKGVKDLLFPNVYQSITEVRDRFQPTTIPEKFAQPQNNPPLIDEVALTQKFATNLQIFIDICRAHQIQPILMTQANRLKDTHDNEAFEAYFDSIRALHGIEYSQIKSLYDAFNETTRQVGRKNQILVIDLAQKIPQDQEYLYDLVHLNNQGSILAAEIISQQILEQTDIAD